MVRLPESPDVVRWQRTTTNGDIPRRQLEAIVPPQHDPDLDDDAVMYPPAAAAMSDLLRAARDAGHPVRVLYSYRTFAKQQEKYEAYLARGKTPPRAAFPGTSNHGEALTVDFTDLNPTDIAWLRNNAARFRFDEEDNPSHDEPWHWTFRGGYQPEEDDLPDPRFDELIDGIEAYNRNEASPDSGPGKKIWTALRDAESKPKPAEPPAPVPTAHHHRVNITRRKTGGPLV